jgi:hypothetical protein
MRPSAHELREVLGGVCPDSVQLSSSSSPRGTALGASSLSPPRGRDENSGASACKQAEAPSVGAGGAPAPVPGAPSAGRVGV